MLGEDHLAVVEPLSAPRHVALKGEISTIGSGGAAEIRLADADVAALHAEIHRDGSSIRLVRRAAPLWVNGKRVREQELQVGDLVTLGRSAFSLRHGPVPAGGDEDREQAVEVCRRIYELSRRLGSAEELDDLVEQMLADVVALTRAERGMLALFKEGDPVLARVSSRQKHSGDFSTDEQQLSQTVIAEMVDKKRPLLWVDARRDDHLAFAPSVQDAGLRSVMCAPIARDDHLLGALYLSSSLGPGAFDQHALDLLTVYANLAAQLLGTAGRDRTLRARVEQMSRRLDALEQQPSGVIGSSGLIQKLLVRCRKVAVANIPVLLLGETGTGKGMMAREIHRMSERSGGPFIAVHCGAIPEQLLESELFGHTRGAFTGASEERRGCIRSAHGGTLFLDEIGEMPLAQQTKLLKVLEDGEVRPVGGDRIYKVDFRLVCATNRDLGDRVEAGTFRSDLYFRIAGIELALPPLRERGDDAVELAKFFVKRNRADLDDPELRLSAAAITAIRRHAWPGNVRELEAAIRRGAVLAERGSIEAGELGIGAAGQPDDPPSASASSPDDGDDQPLLPLAEARERFIVDYIRTAVARMEGNRTAAARQLQISPRTVFKYLEEI